MKGYTDVVQMIRDIANDTELTDEVMAEIDRRKIISTLMSYRAARGLSQADVAERMKCTQSRISKLESSYDRDVRFGDLCDYAKAVDCNLKAGAIPNETKPADMVIRHALAIKKHMDDMAVIARSDEDIAKGVVAFFFEVFVNFSAMIGGAIHALPKKSDGSPYCEFRIANFSKAKQPRLQDAPGDVVDCDSPVEAEDLAPLR